MIFVWILATIGAVGVFLIGLIGAGLYWSEFQDGRVERERKRQYRNDEMAARRLGAELICDHHWFSEDSASMNLMRELGKHLCEEGRFRSDAVRTNWRKANNDDDVIARTREAKI